MVGKRPWVGFGLMTFAFLLLMGGLFTPWYSVERSFDNSSETVLYGSAYAKYDAEVDGETMFSDRSEYKEFDDDGVKGAKLAIAGNIVNIVGVALMGSGAILLLVGNLTTRAVRITGASIALGAVLVAATGAVLTTMGTNQINDEIMGEPKDENGLEVTGMIPSVGIIIVGIAVVAGATGGGLSFGRNKKTGTWTPPDEMAPPVPVRNLKCPRCSHGFQWQSRARPECPSCSFS